MGVHKLDQIPMFDNLPAEAKEVSFSIFSANVRTLMDRSKVKLVELSLSIDVPASTIHDWYMGNVTAPILNGQVKRFAEYFEIDITTLAFELIGVEA